MAGGGIGLYELEQDLAPDIISLNSAIAACDARVYLDVAGVYSRLQKVEIWMKDDFCWDCFFFGLGLEDLHVSTFWVLLYTA